MGAVVPTYDAKGNLVSASTGSTTTYSYSTKNELVGRSDTGVGFYYDPLGRLDTVVNAPGGQYGFQYDGDQISTEYAATTGSPILRRYVYGPNADEPIVWYEGADFTNKRYLVADERGSIVAVTDASGAATAINTYDEYGIPGTANQGRLQFTGQAWLSELGMYSFKARIYSPTFGRFLQTDPAGYPDGPNWYNYVNSDPVNKRDPSGLGGCLVAIDDDRCFDGIVASAPAFPEPPPATSIDWFTPPTLDPGAGGGSIVVVAPSTPIDDCTANPQNCITVSARRVGPLTITGDVGLILIAGNEWDSGLPRDIDELKRMLDDAKRTGDTQLARRIIKQLKVASARNINKLRGLGKFRFVPPLIFDPRVYREFICTIPGPGPRDPSCNSI